MLQEFGEGLADVLQIQGPSSFSPIDKLKAIMVTAKGIPEPYMVQVYTKDQKEYRGFSKLFGKIFGSAWEKGMALHTFLTLPLIEQLRALETSSKHHHHQHHHQQVCSQQTLLYHQATSNLVNTYIFQKLFHLEEKEQLWAKSIIRMAFSQDTAFVPIAPELV